VIAVFQRRPPAGCASNADDLLTQRAGIASLAIAACAAVGPRSIRLRRRRRTIPESSRFCGLNFRVRVSTVVGALALCAHLPLALFR
jgi:hypothetical protein